MDRFRLNGPVRAFVALPIPPGLRTALEARIRRWRSSMAPGVRWSKPGTAHLTLRFLGDSGPLPLERLDDRLARIAPAAGPVIASSGSTGAFPDWSRPRVLWLGIESGGAIERLAAEVEEATRRAGFEPEERAFTPHLTIARVRGPRGARAAVDAVRDWSPDTDSEPIDEMILYRSELREGGARHFPLARYSLEGTEA